jgi:hypothetical protein
MTKETKNMQHNITHKTTTTLHLAAYSHGIQG